MQIPQNAKLLFIGDSITDCGRSRSTPASPWETASPIGNGYVSFFKTLVENESPESKFRILNRGVGGNTVRDLALRWQRDVIHLAPDWLFIKIGINDVWRQFDSPRSPHVHVLLDEFETTYTELLKRTRPTLDRLFLITPYYLHTDTSDPMRARMDEYRKIVAQLSTKFDATLIDTQRTFDDLMQHTDPLELAEDRVHPGKTGHMAIAQAIHSTIKNS